MYTETVSAVAGAAGVKAAYFRKRPLGYLAAAICAGMFVGFGIVLIFSIGAPFAAISSPAVKLIMGASFGIALTLVIMSGSELFTGLNLIMPIGVLLRKASLKDLALLWIVSYFGNLLGSLALSWLMSCSGLLNNQVFATFVTSVAAAKMHAPMSELFVKGILCNMLVCLAVWMSFRLTEEIAKMAAIFWCLFAFIASGFEHSIANMTLLSLPLFIVHDPQVVSWVGFARNLLAVTAGNIIGGTVLIAGLYAFISLPRRAPEKPVG